jgi:hypothetical protein
MSSLLRDWKYPELVAPGRQARSERIMRVRSPYLRPVAAAFYINIGRAGNLALFPAEVAVQALGKQLIEDYAIFKVTGKLSIRRRAFNKKTLTAITKEILRQRKAQKNRYWSGKEDRAMQRITKGVQHINELAGSQAGSNKSVEVILSSVCVESWIAFEILCTDLWFLALDHGSPDWRKRVKLREHKLKGDDDDSQTPLESVDLNQIADPQEKYGTSFRDKGVSFRKLAVIKYWYKTTFGSAAEKLFNKNKRICALSAVRNAIVHKEGRADRKYLNAVKEFPELQTDLNRVIPLDGEVVRELRNVAINLGTELLLYVDGVLTSPN